MTSAQGAYGTLSWTYDAVGNRLSQQKTSGTTTNHTNTYAATSNRLQSVTDGGVTRGFTYTPSGNVAVDDRGAQDDLTFTSNAANRLVSISSPTQTLASMAYDGLGRRVQLISGGVTTKYHYDSTGRLIAISDGSGNWSETVWLGDLPVAQASGSNVYAIHSDQTGQPGKMTNASGALVWQRTAQPFGETYAESGSIATVLRFPGQVADAATATHYNMARDYDPSLGRYLQSDPIGLAGGWNTYGYAMNNPLRYTDPTGEFVPLAILGGFAVGAGSELAIQAGMNWWNGKDVFDPDCYEWGEVALAGGLGAFGGAWTKSAVRLTAGSMKWNNVSRRIRRAEGMIGNPEEQLHHWAITQKMAKKLRLPDGLVNRPWNLNRVPTDFHTRLHNMNPLLRTVRGAPHPVQAAGILGAAGAAGEMADGVWE